MTTPVGSSRYVHAVHAVLCTLEVLEGCVVGEAGAATGLQRAQTQGLARVAEEDFPPGLRWHYRLALQRLEALQQTREAPTDEGVEELMDTLADLALGLALAQYEV